MVVRRWSGVIARQLQHSKWAQLAAVLCTVLAVYNFYNLSMKLSFSDVTKDDHKRANHATDDATLDLLSVSNSKQSDETVTQTHGKGDPLDILITFTKAEHNSHLKDKFRTTVMSMFKFATSPINLHILGDEPSERIARDIVANVAKKEQYQIVHLNIDELVKGIHKVITDMQKFFSYKPGAYFSDALFFLSLMIHRVLPDHHRIIMLDADLKFNADIQQLYDLFDDFSEENIIGLARECQPVYRHTFHMYRNRHKDTRVGGPPPDGLTGFNSGVILIDLDRMRKSDLYNSLLNDDKVKKLTDKYQFKGHLGDQDFFTLISLEYERLFYILPCSWNRQLCDWWRNHGYVDVFDQYFKCDGHINIYHGNCNTKIPVLDWEK